MRLSSQVALVTGSAQGIGRAIALRLAEEGATVVVSDRDESTPMGEVVKEITSKGGQAVSLTADVSHAEEVNHLLEEILSRLSRIDIMVNNAGITRDQLLLRMSEEDWDRVLSVNLKGAFLCTRAALRPMLKQRRGRIVNIASITGLIGNPGQANYAASKGGLIAFTKTTAKEVASRGITVNAIAPGFIDTAMTRALSQNVKEEILKQIPLGFFGKPEDVAAAVAFLASEDARYITGQVLTVDGGLVMA